MSRQKRRHDAQKRNKRKRSNRRSASYGRLEDRILLAVDLTGRNLITNGGFQQVQTGDDPHGFFDDSLVDGWTAVNADAGQEITIFTIESQRSAVLQIDSSADVFDALSQSIDTESGTQYVLAFDVRTRPVDLDADPLTNDLEVLFGGSSLGQFTAVSHWQTITLELDGQGGLSDLIFQEVAEPGSPGGDGRGPLLDNIRLFAVSDATIENGSFESATGGDGDLFDSENVSGFTAIATDENAFIQIVDSEEATDGNRFLSLDTSAEVLDRVFQDVATTAEGTYFLSFDLRSSSGEPDTANELRVRWNDQYAGTFRGDGDWQNFGLVLTADSDSTRLVFREATLNGGFSTGDGPEIDNVRLFRLDSADGDVAIDLNGAAEGENSTATFTSGNGPQTIASGDLAVTNLNGGQIALATVVLSNSFDFLGDNATPQESLSVITEGTNIQAAFSPQLATLRLTGLDSIENYEAVLRTLQYNNTAETPNTTDRIIAISVSENGVTSNAGTIEVVIDAENEAPVFLQQTEDQSVEVGETLQQSVTAFDPNSSGITYSVAVNGQQFLQDGPQPTISNDGTLTWTPDRLGTINVTVTATDGTGVATSMTFDLTSFATNDEQRIQNYLLENDLESETTESGLHFIVDQEGNGNFPNANSNVTVNYSGVLLDGTPFDSNEDIAFSLQQVIPGWTEGIPLFSEGGSGTLILPAELGYGAAGLPGIVPPNSILIFDVDLLSFV